MIDPATRSGEPRFIWATRGRTWGFRFLRDGGFADPLAEYEASFSPIADEHQGWRRSAGRVAVRFPDPEQRRDAAGRVIPHDVVVMGAWSDQIDSLERGIELIWPLISDEFGRIWDQRDPPRPH